MATNTDRFRCCDRGTAVQVLPLRAPFAEGQAERIAAAFKALADPTRVRIVAMALTVDEICVCHITQAFPLSQPTISHHLGVLRRAGILRVTERGAWAYYSVTDRWRKLLQGGAPFALQAVAASM